jgi:hypothetical protein
MATTEDAAPETEAMKQWYVYARYLRAEPWKWRGKSAGRKGAMRG